MGDGIEAETEERSTAPLLSAAKQAFVPVPAGMERIGDSIGPYKLLSILGEGGFGVVYLAERRESIVQRVALKVIKPGMDSKAVIARFEQERQALAVMDHPNVARVYDAGTTSNGRPFFVMEHVQGEPITAYCDLHNLTIKQRLVLFIPVCEAVQHAHMKGIIHRDIKPSNILVMVRDGKPIPKVIDFGVAKAISHTLTEKTIFTERGQLIGTPEYMSPEQAEMSATDIDTRSDVYSLGVVLYQLLTGALPFEPRDLRSKGYDEVRRIIREVDPPKPSTRLSSLRDSRVRIARHRQMKVDELARELSRELDWIPLKAMRKDRTERYRTASDVADDVRRYLNGEPLEAGPESVGYHLLKFLRRHKGPTAAVAGIIIALTAGLISTWSVMQRALAAEADAQGRTEELEAIVRFQTSQISDIDTARMGDHLREGLLELRSHALIRSGASPEAVADALRAFEESLAGLNFTNLALQSIEANVLDRALEAVDEQFSDQPLLQAQLLSTVSRTCSRLGLIAQAMDPQERALDIRRRELGESHPDTLSSAHDLAWILMWDGKHDEAERHFRRVLEIRRRTLGDHHLDTLATLDGMGSLLYERGEFAEAERLARLALEGRRRVLGDDHRDTLHSFNNMGIVLQALGRYSESETFYREALDRRTRVLGPDHPNTLSSIHNVGSVLSAQGKYAQATSYARAALEGRRRVLGDDHPQTLGSINNVGWALMRQGFLDEAAPFLQEAMDARRHLLGDERVHTLRSINNVGMLLRKQGDLEQAERRGAEAVEIAQRILPATHHLAAFVTFQYAQTLAALERYSEAEVLMLQAHASLDEMQHGDRSWLAEVIEGLVSLYDAWHAAEPNDRYSAEAAIWRTRLDALENAASR